MDRWMGDVELLLRELVMSRFPRSGEIGRKIWWLTCRSVIQDCCGVAED